MCPPGIEFIVNFYACLYAGVISAPIQAPPTLRLVKQLARLESVVSGCQPRLIITSRELCNLKFDVAKINWKLAVPVWQSFDEDLPADDATELPLISSDGIAFLQYTSGSTSAPKGVVISHANIIANQRLIVPADELAHHRMFVSWLPHFHDMGLTFFMQVVFSGVPGVFMSPAHFIQKPLRWLKAISTYQATGTVSPNFGLQECLDRINDEDLNDINLASMRRIMVGAERVRANTINSFYTKFSKCNLAKEVFTPCYGLAESTVLATSSETAIANTLKFSKSEYERGIIKAESKSGLFIELVSSGSTGPMHDIRIVNDNKICADLEVGEIYLRGPSVAKRYWSSEVDSDAVFGHTLPDGEGDYLKTGDLGFIHQSELYVTGRIKDLIIVSGRNVYPDDIEAFVEASTENITPRGVAAVEVESNNQAEVVVIIEVARDKNLQHSNFCEDIRRRVTKEIEIPVSSVVLVKRFSLPKTSSGKIRRSYCKSLFENNELQLATF